MSFKYLSLFFIGLIFINSPALALKTNGQEFWVSFVSDGPTYNFGGVPQTIILLLNSSVNTTATVLDPSIGVPANYPVSPGTTTTVNITRTSQMILANDNTVTHEGIHVTAPDDITVYGVDYIQAQTDGYLALPVTSLGTDYMVTSYVDDEPSSNSEIGIVSTVAGTNVTITPSVTADGNPAGIPFIVTLPNAGDTYELGATSGDLTGTVVHADQPIVVYGANACSDVPSGYFHCNALIEELWPITSWGTSFVTYPLATRTKGDTFRFLASVNATTVNVNGVAAAPINRGQFIEEILTTPSYITANQPIYIMQYSNSASYDASSDINYDPFMISVIPISQFQSNYNIGIPAAGFGFTPNYENIFVPTSSVGTILMDGVAIPPGSFTAIGASGYSGAQISVSTANHVVTGPVAFGDLAYGFALFDGYGYPAGMGAVVATPTATSTITPTNTPTATNTPVNTSTTTSTLTQTNTPTATYTPVNTSTFTPTLTPSNTPTATHTATITPTFSPTETYTPTCVTYVWPDPYNPKTAVGGTIRFSCMDAQTNVLIYTLSGELVQTINSGTSAQNCSTPNMWGTTYCWNGRNKMGAPVATGIYLYVVQQKGAVTQHGKFLLVEGS